ncbi:hypothetical protein JCM10212_004278 [Sporobolomyces blumeae]
MDPSAQWIGSHKSQRDPAPGPLDVVYSNPFSRSVRYDAAPRSTAAPAHLDDERYPQLDTSFSLVPRSRNHSAASTSSASSSSAANGSDSGRLSRTVSSPTWGNHPFGGGGESGSELDEPSHDVELLLGEEGRGKAASPARRSAAESAAANKADPGSLFGPSGWTAVRYGQRPVTPQSTGARPRDDLDVTPKGVVSSVHHRSTPRKESTVPSTRPLHTPPQVLPATAHRRTPSASSSPHQRTASQPISSALRPTSSQSSSNSSSYSSRDDEDENAWATRLAESPTNENLSSVRSPLFLSEGFTSPTSFNQSPTAPSSSRPLSEFDFAAAYARSDTASLPPNSPLLPTVPTVQPASPTGPSPEVSRPGSISTSLSSAHAATPLANEDPSPAPASSLLQPTSTQVTTPSGSRAPSPAPSLSPDVRPSSRASSARSVSSPVRPPRRQASNLNLNYAGRASSAAASQASATPVNGSPHKSGQTTLLPPVSGSVVEAGVTPFATAPEQATSEPSPLPNANASATAASPTPSTTTSTTSQRSPRPPSIPEKSRRRASVLGLGTLKSREGARHSRNGSTDLGGDGTVEGGAGRTSGEVHRPNLSGGERTNSGESRLGESNVTSPSTPLSASDFAEVYGRLDWDAASTKSLSPTVPRHAARSSHIREGAGAYDGESLSPASSAMVARQASARSDASSGNLTNENGHEDVFLDARGTAPNSPAIGGPGSGPPLEIDTDVAAAGSSAETPSASTPGAKPDRSLNSGATSPSTARSATPKGDAKARAAAFIADLKRARQEAQSPSAAPPAEPVEDDSFRPRIAPRSDEEEPTVEADRRPSLVISPVPEDEPSLPSKATLPRSTSTSFAQHVHHDSQSSSSTKAQLVTRPPSRSISSYSSFAQTPPALPLPLLRRRPLPPSIQISGELRKCRTAGERARTYAAKINELAKERSRLDEWLDSVRDLRSAVGRVSTVPTSPLKQARSFRQDASTATFAPRGDGYRAKELVSHTFGPNDLAPSAPYPGVLGFNNPSTHLLHSGHALTSTPSRSTLGSGLPSASAGGPGRPSFFARSLGRRASKRDASPIFHSQHATSTPRSAASLTISNPSPLLYSSSSATSVGEKGHQMAGPRMPGTSRASIDSRNGSPHVDDVSATTSSPQFAYAAASSSNAKRASLSYGSTSTLTSPLSSSDSSIPSSFHPSSLASNPTSPTLLVRDPEPPSAASVVNQAALARLADILPQANERDLVDALKKSGGDDVLAISVYLSEEATRKR